MFLNRWVNVISIQGTVNQVTYKPELTEVYILQKTAVDFDRYRYYWLWFLQGHSLFNLPAAGEYKSEDKGK